MVDRLNYASIDQERKKKLIKWLDIDKCNSA